MRVLHFADVHLGYRAYNRVTEQGINQREADVFKTFEFALEAMAELQPDLVLMAGDLFHVVRPSNLVIHHAFRRLQRFAEKVKCPVVMIAGNHESPRSADAGCILSLYSNISGIITEDLKFSSVRIDELDLQVVCVPHRGLRRFDETPPSPDPRARYNILMVHGTLQGIQSGFYDTYIVPRDVIRRENWDYIALGHYHKFTKIWDNAFYSGSLEYTSPNFWEELDSPKGFIEYDLENRKLVNFHRLEPLREFVMLGSIDAEGLSASEVDGKIATALGRVKGGVAGKVVRLVVENIPRDVQRDLDHKALRTARAEALHLDLVFVLPKRKRPESLSSEGWDGSRHTLEQDWSEYVDSYTPPKGVDREELKQLGLQYLARVTEASDATDIP